MATCTVCKDKWCCGDCDQAQVEQEWYHNKHYYNDAEAIQELPTSSELIKILNTYRLGSLNKEDDILSLIDLEDIVRNLQKECANRIAKLYN